MIKMASLLICCALAQNAVAEDRVLVDFGAEALPDFIVWNNTSSEWTSHEDAYATRVRFERTDWPNVTFRAPDGVWDWSQYAGVAVSLYNPGEETVAVAMRVDNEGADGMHFCNNASGGVAPGQRFEISLRFKTGAPEAFWGMRGVPGRGPLGTGADIDPAKITAFQVFLPRPPKEYELIFERAVLFGKAGQPDAAVALPFVDRFGQYKHADWPGKTHNEAELAVRRDAEEAALDAAPVLPDRDRFGGWAGGPKREATGWFRTEEIDGKWWLITPEGTLFLSIGMDCVGTWERTFVTGRDSWFEWLPGEEESAFQPFYADVSNAHSGAEAIGGKGRTFSFYSANLVRKYGDDWARRWRESAYRRLQAWGFNTIANWSQEDVLRNSPMPYVVSSGVWGVRPVEGGTGYWSKMMDVFAPEFPERAENAFIHVARSHAENPLCIGYFVDNELAWEGVRNGILESPADQPARQELIRRLEEQYGTIEALNKAWNTKTASWDDLRTPRPASTAANKDLDDFLYAFAQRYFETLRDACRRHTPNQLYLGCRFAGPPPDPVTRACAGYADIVSFNLYYQKIPLDQWTGPEALGKPVIIGEFHFGALDRGMFHTGLVATADQNDRAMHYQRYLRSIADHPAFVGCHWFQYIDEPITGRWFDGENYNIGFVDVTDTPYPEMVDAARQVHAEMYPRRYRGSTP